MPLSRLSTGEICRAAVARGLVAAIGETTVWRWLAEDAIRPWCHRNWIFPRDPDFARKAGQVPDLYEGRWNGKTLTDDEYVIARERKCRSKCTPRAEISPAPLPLYGGIVESE